ncbi:MAG TPA: HAMP domain-containing protein, partial [Myxococcota bacterium]|nr:HAMP domain-containing protein [Myxococcota bacterium]
MRSTLSLRATLVIAAILPVALFTVGTAAVLYSVAGTQLERGMQERLDTIAAFLVGSARSSIASGSLPALREDVLSALAERDVVHISVYDREGRLLDSEGDPAVAPLEQAERRIDAPEEFRALSSRLDELRVAIRDPRPAAPALGLVRIVISAERSLAEYRQLLLSSSAVLAAALFVGIGLAALLWRNLLRAIALLGDTVRRVGAGDLGAQVPELGPGELGALGRAFNDMTR